jgi:hypothetical protein
MEWYNDRELRRDVLLGQTAGAVCLRYVDAPHFYECLIARGLPDRLQAFQKQKVRVAFEVSCRRGEVVGYRITAIDGRDVGILENALSGRMGGGNPPGEFPFFGACG